jgi:NAD(P)-dependent dehydrogenase (short-subunit alcohol dehydrogenase family)
MKRTRVDTFKPFDLSGRTAIITGGGGLLGIRHGEAIAAAGGIPIIVDIKADAALAVSEDLRERFGVPAMGVEADITVKEAWEEIISTVIERFDRADILVNNAANNPKVDKGSLKNLTRFENFSLRQWSDDFAVGVTGAFLGCQVVGKTMADQGKGVIVNIASDLSVIAPDQRIYRTEGFPEDQQNVKPVSYSVVKHALIGLTKYLATYWAEYGVRVNALSPGGVYVNQPDDFVERLSKLIPAGRMARDDEYQAALLFLCSDASSYMTGHNLVMDGGRSVW